MKRQLKEQFKRGICLLVTTGMLAQPIAVSAAQLTLSQSPLFAGGQSIPPMVMLDMSKDQQLYKKAYNDYSDLDGDGAIETTYKHGIDYYGYFDPYKCYTYSTTNKRFEPAVYNTKTATEASNSTNNMAAKYCSASGTQSTQWSGNFLNWSTMMRIDAVRKLLYGGMRSANRSDGDGSGIADGDTATSTVLERATLPNDAHSFVKYYAGADVSRLTPFTSNPISTTSSTSIAIGTGDKTFTLASTSNFNNDDVALVVNTASGNYMSGKIKNKSSTQITLDSVSTDNLQGSGNTYASWTVTNLSRTGVSICNTTKGGSSPQNRSQTNTNLPRLRIAQGNFSLWASNERWQCGWSDEHSASPGNNYSASSVPALNSTPDRSTFALDNKSSTDGKGDYFVRVQACVQTLIGTEKCKEYNTNGSSKPIGLLQVYGESGQIQFGLMTGSYNKNISGGVLRKNVGPLSDEINADGTFTALAAAGVPGGTTMGSGKLLPAGGSIITTLNKIRIWGYNYDDGTYIGGGDVDDCNYQLTSITQGKCVSWGNPMSEIYYESLRYFAGATAPTSAFNTDDTNRIAGLATATWPNANDIVLNSTNYCAPINILLFNASVPTNENDSQFGNPFVGISSFDAYATTTTVGAFEGISGSNKYFIGRTSQSGTSTTTDNEYCDAKTQTGLGNMYGICPEGPTLAGSYMMAGLAYTAHTNKIRNNLTVAASDTKSLKVNTYGISLATNTPRLSLTLSGETSPRAVIQPAYRMFSTPPQGGGTLVDLQIVQQSTTTTSAKGKIYVNWEDSEQGGDYDSDVWGTLSYCMQTTVGSCPGQGANTIGITTVAVFQATANGQGFGYIVSGTSKDGPHFHSGVLGFNYTDPTNVTVSPNSKVNSSGGCNDCQAGDPATTVIYNLSSTAPGLPLNDPLWYAAKYGGFTDSDNSGTFTTGDVWDQVKSDGTAGTDGTPDNYFLVTNPIGLETSLNKLFISIINTASASAASANSSRLTTTTKVYQAVFSTKDWSSQLLSYGVNASTGALNTASDWDAGQVSLGGSASAVPMTSSTANSRVVLTYNKGALLPKGIPFRYPANSAAPTANELSATQITSIRTNPGSGLTDTDTVSQNRLNWLRGDPSNEGQVATDFRQRQQSKLGDIVDSNIAFVGLPSAGYADPSYYNFVVSQASRPNMLYVGANDGMLHGFDASNGQEKLAYVPAKMFPKLNKLTQQTYSHTYFVDGSPVAADVQLTVGAATPWKTVLVGGYNAGGQGIYMLDITDPSSFSESNAASIVKWEFTDKDDPDLGYTFGQPAVVKMANGKWAALVASGYNNSDTTTTNGETLCTSGAGTTASPYLPVGCTTSLTGSAYLFILYLDGPTTAGTWTQGTNYFKIKLPDSATAGTPNGLAAPLAVDVTGDSQVDYAYAGDLYGNMWKFDLSSSTTSNWTLSTSVFKLFAATDSGSVAQPITSRPELALHPTGVGYIVSFGTGKYLEYSDTQSPFLNNSVYGIWDKNNSSTTISAQTTVLRSKLMQQKMLTSGSISGVQYRVLSKFFPNYTSADINYTATQVSSSDYNRPADSTTVNPQLGWYFDLSNNSSTYVAGERNVFNADLRNGIAFFSTLWPGASICEGLANGDNLVFNIGTGGRLDFSVFDADGNGLANSSDYVAVGSGSTATTVSVSSLRIQGGASQTPTFVRIAANGASGSAATGVGTNTSGGSQNVGYQSTTGGKMAVGIYNFGGDYGRISWREIVSD